MNKNIVKYLILLTLISLCPLLRAEEVTLWTTHPQVQHDLNLMAQLYRNTSNEPVFTAKVVFNLKDNVDIHQFSPSSGELKRLITFSPLIAGPTPHQPWLKLAKSSGLLQLKTTLFLNEFKEENHYWLRPKEALRFEKKMNKFFKAMHLPTRDDYPWSALIQEEALKIKEILKAKKIGKIVLAHNALAPLLKESAELVVLFTDDHHSEVASSELKKVFQWVQRPEEVLFIFEKSISWPSNLKGGSFDKVRSVQWAPISSFPLRSLRKALEENL